MGSLEPGVSTGGLLTEFGLILHGVSPQKARLSTAKSIGGNGFERIVEGQVGRIQVDREGLRVGCGTCELELRAAGVLKTCQPLYARTEAAPAWGAMPDATGGNHENMSAGRSGFRDFPFAVGSVACGDCQLFGVDAGCV